MIARLLKTWRAEIPAMECEPGCRECCEGYAPAMTKWEWLQIPHPGKYATGRVIEGCPFLEENGCAIYTRRPLICRIFGTVAREEVAAEELAATLPVFCPRGRAPEAPWPLARALTVQVRYQEFAGRELRRIIEDWLNYLPQRQPEEEMPEKFAWLRYVLSTRDGQAALTLMAGINKAQINPVKMARMAAMVGG